MFIACIFNMCSLGIQVPQLQKKFCICVRKYTGLLTQRNSKKDKVKFTLAEAMNTLRWR